MDFGHTKKQKTTKKCVTRNLLETSSNGKTKLVRYDVI